MKNVKLADLFPSFATATKSNHIYINENLTNYRRHLVGIRREKKKEGVLLSVWTMGECSLKPLLMEPPSGFSMKKTSKICNIQDC